MFPNFVATILKIISIAPALKRRRMKMRDLPFKPLKRLLGDGLHQID
jgi:hypothetical protein